MPSTEAAAGQACGGESRDIMMASIHWNKVHLSSFRAISHEKEDDHFVKADAFVANQQQTAKISFSYCLLKLKLILPTCKLLALNMDID